MCTLDAEVSLKEKSRVMVDLQMLIFVLSNTPAAFGNIRWLLTLQVSAVKDHTFFQTRY